MTFYTNVAIDLNQGEAALAWTMICSMTSVDQGCFQHVYQLNDTSRHENKQSYAHQDYG